MAATWNLLPLGVQRECATADCCRPAAYEMEASGVASNYCCACRDTIERILHRGPANMVLACGVRALTNGEVVIRIADDS